MICCKTFLLSGLRQCLFLYFILFPFFRVIGQKQKGIPYIRNYSAAEYGAGTDNWAAIQDKRGVMYFGNFSGVLEYDGVRWRTIPVANQSLVRSLAVDSLGIIYVGAVGEFGYLSPNKFGKLVYHSLLDLLPPEYREFSDVWKTYATPSGIYFQTFDYLFLFSRNGIKTHLPSGSFHFSFFTNNKLFITDRGRGLLMMDKDSLVLAPQGEFFSEKRIYSILPYQSDTVLISSREEGLFLMKIKKEGDEKKFIFPFPCEADKCLMQLQTYHGIQLRDSSYAFATRLGGVVVVDKLGSILRIINKKTQLQNENVRYIFSDSEEGLWMALDDGIARAEIASPINIYSDISGFKGAVSDVIKFNNSIYITTTQGIFRLDESKNENENLTECFFPVKNLSAQCWDLIEVKIKEKKEGILLAASTDGIYEIRENQAILINNSYSFRLYQSKKNPERIFAGTYNGLFSFRYENNSWKSEGILPGTDTEIRSISEDESGNVFLGMPFLGVSRIRFCDECKNIPDTVYETSWKQKYVIDKYDTSGGLPDLVWNTVFESTGGIKAGTFKGLFSFDYAQNKFVPETRYGKQFADGSRQVYCFVEKNNDQWIYTANSKNREISLIRNGEIIFKPFKRFFEHEIHTVNVEDSTRLWLGSANGLINYDLKTGKKFDLPFGSLVRKVVAGKDSIIFSGTNYSALSIADSLIIFPTFSQPADIIFSLPFILNSIAFEFSAPSFDNEASNSFRWLLEGYDTEWTAWTKEQKTHYTNLREGKYKFRLQSRNIYETIGEEAGYEFIVLPPWYRTIAAYVFYLFFLIGLIYASVKISVRRLEKAKIRLEKIVTERTAEVVKQKEKIESQNHQLEHKNKEITDSINYARRIQEAILPAEDYLKACFSDYFVLFKPKDIVSGDFFWAYKVPQDFSTAERPSSNVDMATLQKSAPVNEVEKIRIIWAAVDCTGHGVPGAFMSMIGNSLLNEIVVENKINDSDEILNHLRESIIKSLKQTGEAGKQKDGMDIALCVFDRKKESAFPGANNNEAEAGVLQFSGANNPLWLIRKGELITFKPDKQPIGYYSEYMKPFTKQEIRLQKGDMIYTFTDGYEDQFGGPKRKKFMAKQLRELLISIQEKSMKEQKEILNTNIESWMGAEEQIDDICVFGVRV